MLNTQDCLGPCPVPCWVFMPPGWREEQDLLQNLPSTTACSHICRWDLKGSSGHLLIQEQHLEQWQRGFL